MPPAPGFIASSRLGIKALGNAGAAAIERGIHLRWGFDPEIGYPAQGFRLYRRDAQGRPPDRCLTISPALLLAVLQQGWAPLDEDATIRVSLAGVAGASLPAATLSVPVTWRRFDIELGRTVLLQRVGLQGQKGVALVFGLLGGRPAASRAIAAGGPTPIALFDYPMVDTVLVYTATGGPAAVCFAEVGEAAEGEWSKNLLPAAAGNGETELGLGLPLTHPDYNLHHRFEDGADPASGDFREAEARLIGSGASLDGDDFDELRGSLALMVDETMPGRMFDREIFRTAEGVTPFLERPLDLSLLFGLDPDMARVAGLYFVDTDVEPGKAYDYLLVGRWTGWQLPEPATAYSFASVPEGTLLPRRFALCGAAITLPTKTRVTSEPRINGRQTRKALMVRNRSSFWFSNEPATIRFAEPQRWVVVELGARQEPIHISAQRFGFEVDDATVPAGDDAARVLLRPPGIITELEITGSDYVLYGMRALAASRPAQDPVALEEGVALGSLVLDVRFADAPPLAAPSGMRLRGVPMPTSEQPALTLDEAEAPLHDDPQGLGLAWNPAPALGIVGWPADLGRRQPTEAAGYELRYQFLGNNAAAGPIDPARWRAGSDGRVSISPPASQDEQPETEPLVPGDDVCIRFPATAPPLSSQFAPDADLWLVPWVPEGWYAAEVRAIDVFGRTSPWASGGPTLTDAITPPPPPQGLEAKLLQAADPELNAEERALITQHGDGCVRVTWEWPSAARRQAPHASSFRVYVNRRPFNRLRARVVSVGPGAVATELTCAVEAEEALTADGLVDSTLVDGNRVAYRILGNGAGTSATLRLRRHAVETAFEPIPGNAAIVIHPGSAMYERPERRDAWEARVAQAALNGASRYEVIVPPSGINPTRADPMLHARIGVSSADGSPRAPETFIQPAGPPWDPALGGLPGREGGVGTVGIVARLFAPLPVSSPAPRDRLYTTRPDFFGRCTYELRWPHVAAAGRAVVGWKVYRATDRAVFGLYDPDPAVSRIDASALPPSDRAELDAAFPGGLAATLSDDVIRRLAGQLGADQAFTAATETALRSSSATMSFVDAVDGKNTVRYLWRMRTEDDAGNLSPLGDATDPVYVPNTYPPAEVKVSDCRGGERQVELSLVPNHEVDLAGYLVYSTEPGLDPDTLESIRLLRRATGPETGAIEAYDRAGVLVAPVLDLTRAAADALLQDGLVVVTRQGIAGGRTVLYRLAAYDTAGNPSVLTRVFTARTTGIVRPEPPKWGVPQVQPDGLHLTWSAPTADLNCLLQRSRDGQTWVSVGTWRGRGNYAAIDAGHEAGVTAQYRLRVMQPNGQTNRDFAVLDV